MWLIAGLGNPGKKYRDTRHNAGFRVIDHLGARNNVQVETKMYLGETGRGYLEKEPMVLLKPATYMNRSGLSVASAVRGYDIHLDRLIVVHDDIDIDSGLLKVKQEGGSGGHRGMESLIWALGSGRFFRVRVGVGRPHDGGNAADYVLESLLPPDLDRLDAQCQRAAQAVESLVLRGVEETMRLFHGKEQEGSTASVS